MQKQHPFFCMEYYDTYEFVSVIHDLVENGFESSWYYDGFEDFIEQHISSVFRPFQKFSILHQFISFVSYELFKEEVDDSVLDIIVRDSDCVLWVNKALKIYKIPHMDFREWLAKQSLSIASLEHESVILDYYAYLYEKGPLIDLLEIYSNEAFYILFLNRHFLYQFNKQISLRTTKVRFSDLTQNSKHLFRKDGILRRVNIPMWARKAVFYRDRGIRSHCQKDISGLINIHNAKHFDHIIPLACGGLNDVSNLQLLCETCNLQKKDNEIQASKTYEKWY